MIYINGRFLTKSISGVVRYGIEVVKQFDTPNNQDKIAVLVPKNSKINISFEFIKIIPIGIFTGNLWEQISLFNFMKKHKNDKLLNLCNASPLFVKGYTVVHDITFLYKPRTYSLPFTLWYKFLIKKKINSDFITFTVSQFCKSEIIKYYNVNPNKVVVAPCGINEPVLDIDNSILKKYKLQGVPYYLFVGANYPHKNIDLIFKLAKENPNKTFVLVSKGLQHEYMKNVAIINEPVSNKELKSLYKNADTLIQLSKYEGFGLPPLEAAINGTKNLLLSDIPIFREIYGDGPNYVDINKDFKLPILLPLPKNYISNLAKKYSWKKTADIILKTLEEKTK